MKVRQPLITESEPAQTIPSGSGTTTVAEHTKQCDLQSSSSNEKTRYPVDLETLQPSNWLGMFYMLYATLMTFISVVMSLSENPWMWLAGQVLLAITLIQWFAILHEAGHKTMFKTRWLNRWVCHVSGAFALIPGDCWRLVHAKHHYWTGWQDLDVTTETLVPRELRTLERITINTWRLWIPLFASLYRWNNYWNLPRLRQMFQRPNQKRLVTVNILVYPALHRPHHDRRVQRDIGDLWPGITNQLCPTGPVDSEPTHPHSHETFPGCNSASFQSCTAGSFHAFTDLSELVCASRAPQL